MVIKHVDSVQRHSGAPTVRRQTNQYVLPSTENVYILLPFNLGCTVNVAVGAIWTLTVNTGLLGRQELIF